MEKKNAFTITRARPEDAAALLDYLKIVGGETDNLSFGAEGVPLAPEEEQAYLRTQVDSPDHVQYLARVDGELIGTASLNRKPGRMRHRGVFGISLKRAWWGCGAASALTEAVLAFARENGYVKTLFGRRRYLPELAASNKVTQAFGERVARNTPIQGTAADIIKIAMVRVFERLRREGLRARLILQVHDELIVECPQEEAQQVMQIVTNEMEHAAALRVPLVAEAKQGESWYAAK